MKTNPYLCPTCEGLLTHDLDCADRPGAKMTQEDYDNRPSTSVRVTDLLVAGVDIPRTTEERTSRGEGPKWWIGNSDEDPLEESER